MDVWMRTDGDDAETDSRNVDTEGAIYVRAGYPAKWRETFLRVSLVSSPPSFTPVMRTITLLAPQLEPTNNTSAAYFSASQTT
jgi:hypothetical protein